MSKDAFDLSKYAIKKSSASSGKNKTLSKAVDKRSPMKSNVSGAKKKKRKMASDDFSMRSTIFTHDEIDSDSVLLSSSASTKGNKALLGKKGRKKKKERTLLGKIGRVFLSILLIGVITGCLIVGTFAVYVFGFVDDSMDENLDELTLNFSTTLYVRDKETDEYKVLQRLHGEENRIWISLDKIPQDLVNAYIAIEDKRFLTHTGVDWRRTVTALANSVFEFLPSRQGGSTITQQLVKNLTGDDDTNAMRKVREIMRARYLETTYEKDTIIECYLNTIPLANGLCGVETAAKYYFGKSASDLTLPECASLAAMTKEPEYYRPDINPENNRSRRNDVLSEMYDQNLITTAEFNEANEAELTITANKADLGEVEINSWFVEAVFKNVVEDLMKQGDGMTRSAAETKFYSGGFKIYTTLDTDVQAVIDEIYSTKSYFPSQTREDKPIQSAITIMNYEGHIVGTIGGRGEKAENLSLHRAYVARPPGSSIKPIGVYAPAVEANIIGYGSRWKDEPYTKIKDPDTGRLIDWPKNYYRAYYGSMTIESAVERSVNTIPANIVANYLTFESAFDFLTNKVGVTSLDEVSDLNAASLALGGSTYGISPTEMTAAFATFGNLGKYYKPSTYTKITDQYDQIVMEQAPPKIAFGEDTAVIMNRLLQNVVYGSQGTGTMANYGSMPLFGKTGTTSSEKDRWFVGGSPYYVGACWIGFDKPGSISASGNPAANIWRNVMRRIHSDLEYKTFPDTDAVVYGRYCTSSGMYAGTGCGSTARGWFKSSYMPVCTTHGGSPLDTLKKPPGVAVGSNTNYAGDVASSTTSSSKPTTTSTKPTTSDDDDTTATRPPTTSTAPPVTDAPVTDAPVTDTPVTDAPSSETPVTDTPSEPEE